jgi:CheY-like chemotaxis protein
VGKGTGLGLSIVYGIIKQHNGYVECISTPGRGTAFHIHLPLIDVQTEDRVQPKQLALKRGTETVLVTEDDEAVRRLTRTMLEELGYRVITAADGDEAIRLFTQNAASIDILLMDVIMPKQNGKQAYDLIRKLRPEVKILFTSGYTADVVTGGGLLEQGMHFMAKPASLQVLSQKMRDVLDAR